MLTRADLLTALIFTHIADTSDVAESQRLLEMIILGGDVASRSSKDIKPPEYRYSMLIRRHTPKQSSPQIFAALGLTLRGQPTDAASSALSAIPLATSRLSSHTQDTVSASATQGFINPPLSSLHYSAPIRPTLDEGTLPSTNPLYSMSGMRS